MSKFILATLAAVSFLAISAPAFAGYFTYYYDSRGYYHQCYNEWDDDDYRWLKTCN
jgi:hypothetical protein